ncbi:hypothetical protein EDC94DRAFT_588011 [Helicostylum pulchrum]|nr:hypothetical protein EDC94DRAFT_588011 [Helicostylum pulchrum]
MYLVHKNDFGPCSYVDPLSNFWSNLRQVSVDTFSLVWTLSVKCLPVNQTIDVEYSAVRHLLKCWSPNQMILTNTTNDFEQEVMIGAFGFIDGIDLPIEGPPLILLSKMLFITAGKVGAICFPALIVQAHGMMQKLHLIFTEPYFQIVVLSRSSWLLTVHSLARTSFARRSCVPKKNTVKYTNEVGDSDAQKTNAMITKPRQPG